MSGTQISLDELLEMRRLANHLTLPNQQRSRSHQLGSHLSSLRGRGIDFHEVRGYQPGDDIRLMHWGVTARTGKPHTKIYHEERERPVFIIIDLNPTMYFATKIEFKSVLASRVAALLGWSTIQHGDRPGGMIIHGHDCHEFRPRSRQLSLLPMLKQAALCSEAPPELDQTTDWSSVLSQLQRVAKPGSLICLLSDFYSFEQNDQMTLQSLAENRDVFALRICDPLENTPPPPNRYAITNGLSEIILDTNARQSYAGYQKQLTVWWESQKQLLQQSGVRVIQLTTDGNLLGQLRYGFYH